MLEFAQRPPKSPEDISLSEIGKSVLRHAQQADRSHYRLAALGQAVYSEFADAVGDEKTPLQFLGGQVVHQASEILGNNTAVFVNGIETMHSQHLDSIREGAAA